MNEQQTVYLDHAAATPVDERVVAAMQPYFSVSFYNPSSPYAPAVKVRAELETAKHSIAQTIGARTSDLIMTAGATESINLAMTAAGDGQIVTSAIEHPAVLEAARTHSANIIPVGPSGVVDPSAIASALNSDVQLVSIALANNELGTIQPIRQIAQAIEHERNRRQAASESRPIWLHCDASQGVGQLDINVARLRVDLLTLNAAKCYGPKQVGLLWRTSSVSLRPLVYGGGQEANMRSGTENVAGVIGFSKALELASRRRHAESKRLAALRDELQSRLEAALPNMEIHGAIKKRLAAHLHISFPGIDAERLVFMLENDGVYVATGSACAANHGTRSHVLTAIGLSDAQADGSLRLSLGKTNDSQSIEYAAEKIIHAVQAEQARLAR